MAITNMKAKIRRDKITYYGVVDEKNYHFIFKSEEAHNYSNHVVTPSQIKVLSNDTELSLANLKQHIIEQWFGDENEEARAHKASVAKSRRSKNVHNRKSRTRT